MNAKEMFESLGYEEQFKGSYIYINKKYGSRIAFDDYNGGTIDVVELCYIPLKLLKAINMRCEELGWLDEKTEIKEARNQELTNFEYYKDEILDCCIDNLAVVKGIPKSCSKIDCNDCDFKNILRGCHRKVREWLEQPYKKTAIKLTKFEVDLLQINSIKAFRFKNINVLTLMKEKGYFEDVDEDATIEDILANCEVTK